MRLQIRKNVFETNSSSVHTLTVTNDHADATELRLNDDGWLELDVPISYALYDPEDDGEEEIELVTPEDRLSFLFAVLYAEHHKYDSPEIRYDLYKGIDHNASNYFDDYGTVELLKVLSERIPGLNGIVLHVKGLGRDVGSGDCKPHTWEMRNYWSVVDLYGYRHDESIINFLFNKHANYLFTPYSDIICRYDKSGMEKSRFRKDKEGYIWTDYGSFGRMTDIFSTQSEKLSYIVTLGWYKYNLSSGNWDDEDVEEDEKEYKKDDYEYSKEFEAIEKAVTEYTGCVGLRIRKKREPYIDHQSAPYEEDPLIDIWDKDAVISFVFNKYACLKTGSD